MQNNNTKKDDSIVPEFYRRFAYLRRTQCASASGYTVAFFDKLAWRGEGPTFHKTGKRSPALYPTREFFEWLHNYVEGESA
jgi:hypothetical protein